MRDATFHVAGVPVQVHRSVGLLLLILLMGGVGPAKLSAFDAGMLTGVLLVSALVHELGHALVARSLGLRDVEIILTHFGGLTRHPDPASPARRLAIAVAGPAAGIALGFVTLLLTLIASGLIEGLPPLRRTLWTLIHINLAWSLVNLLPVGPLDGRVLREELGRLRRSGSGAYAWALGGVLCTVGAGALGLALSVWFLL
ncbi:MAG: hypothetical protein H6741_17265 [Alphaproteobacteria bacterium]|nr:hypothetical protein [Alphaproteobacteria bacterium]MCB9794467.1 hypothetical protein [Alphaproteobacteria bacterium]